MPRAYSYLSDGRRVYRGTPPTEVPFHTVDPEDPAIFIPCFRPCKKRSKTFVSRPCGALDLRFFCTYFQKYVEGQNCEDCNDASV